MLSHSSVIRFDPRLTTKFFKKSSGSGLPLVFNFSRIKKDALRAILGKRLDNTDLFYKIYINYLLDYYADFFGYEKNLTPTEIPAAGQNEFKKIQSNILVDIKKEFTLEYLLYHIIEKKIVYSERTNRASENDLPRVLSEIYLTLEIYGADPEFVRNNDRSTENYSNILISLMHRLAYRNYIDLSGARQEKLNASTTAFIIPNCNTVTLIYVKHQGKRKSLITYLREGHKAECENLFPDASRLLELFEIIPETERESVWVNSFNPKKLTQIFRTPEEFASVINIFPEDIREKLSIPYLQQRPRYLTLDPAFMPHFFTGANATEGNCVAEFLTRVRRTAFLKIMLKVHEENGFELKQRYQLANIILRNFAEDLGLIENAPLDYHSLDTSLIAKAQLAFRNRVMAVFNLEYFIKYLYEYKFKDPVNTLLKKVTNKNLQEVLVKIVTLLGVIGDDARFNPVTLIDEEAGANEGEVKLINAQEIELRILTTLTCRLANSGYLNLDNAGVISLENDNCFLFSRHSIRTSYVLDDENIAIPLIIYLFKQGNNVVCQFLLKYPILIPALKFFPAERLKTFYQQNYKHLHLFIENGDNLLEVLPDFSEEQRTVIFKNFTKITFLKCMQSQELLKNILLMVPVNARENIVAIIEIANFQNIFYREEDFLFFIAWAPPQALAEFIAKLDVDYLQNLFSGIINLITLINAIPFQAILACYKKLGERFIKLYLPSANSLNEFAQGVSPASFSCLCHWVSDSYLHEIFIDSYSLGLISYVENNKADFVLKLINLGCHAYDDLFINTEKLSDALAYASDNEIYFLDHLEINYSFSVADNSHLLEILRCFKTSTARLRFCTQFEDDQLSAKIDNFSALLELFNLFDETTILFALNKFPGSMLASLITSPDRIDSLLSKVGVDKREALFNIVQQQPWFQLMVPDRETFQDFKNKMSVENQTVFNVYENKVQQFEDQAIAKKLAEIMLLQFNVNEMNRAYLEFRHRSYVFALGKLCQNMQTIVDKALAVPKTPFDAAMSAFEESLFAMVEILEDVFEKQLHQNCNGFFCHRTPTQLVEYINWDTNNHHFMRMTGLLLKRLYKNLPILSLENGFYYRKIYKAVVANIQMPASYNKYAVFTVKNQTQQVSKDTKGMEQAERSITRREERALRV
jgi:hypothetical protein